MSNLIPEARTDKNGHVVVRHVRADTPASSSMLSVPPPMISRRKTEMEIMERQFRGFKSDSYITDDLEFNPDYDELLANLSNLSDVELTRFGLHLGHTEEETVAFLTPLDRKEYDLLSDMTLIYDAQRHAGISDDEDDEYSEITINANELYLSVAGDHEGMKFYMQSRGVDYRKLDALSQEDRFTALKWLRIRHEADSLEGAIKLDYTGTNGDVNRKVFASFTDPEFLELAMSDPRVMEIAKIHGVSDLERLKLMLSHEPSVTAGVL